MLYNMYYAVMLSRAFQNPNDNILHDARVRLGVMAYDIHTMYILPYCYHME